MSKSSENSCCCRIEFVFAAFILRIWVGMRLFFAGLDKFRAPNWNKEEGITYGMKFLDDKMEKIASVMKVKTPIPNGLVDLYSACLPWALLAVGALIVAGAARKVSLLLGGLLFLSLGMGLMLSPDDFEAVQIGISVAITGFALALAAHDKISVDGMISLATGKGKDGDDA